jgi:hypothetical protein
VNTENDELADDTPRHPLTADTVDIENEDVERELIRQVQKQGNTFMKAHWQELIQKGIMDEHGNLLKQDLPADMKEEANTDFGG